MTADDSVDPRTNLVPESAVRRIVEERLMESQVAAVTDRLDRIPELRVDPAAKVSSHVSGLIARRAELLTSIRGNKKSDILASPHDSVVSNLAQFFAPWLTATLPYFSEGINQGPQQGGTSGSIRTAGLYPGGVGFNGQPQDSGAVQSGTEKWWIHNWNCSVMFPPAPFTGYLYYRFTADTSCLIYNAPAESGLVNAFVTVGVTADTLAGGPFEPANERTVGWPVWVNLPQTAPRFFDQVPTEVSGSVKVQAGKRAAIGFIFGVIAGIANGYVQFGWGSMGIRRTLPVGTPHDGEVFDQIEYRFEPDWWVKAIADRMDLTATS